jgi:Tol biopolymer transport system component
MRASRVPARVLTAGALLALVLAAASAASPSRELSATGRIEASSASAATRILYSSDWSGSFQVYAVDPTGRHAPGQVTFGPAPACIPANPCGYIAPVPSPDGRRLLFWDFVEGGPLERRLFVAAADGSNRRLLARVNGFPFDAVWAPDSRRVAYVGSAGVHVVDVKTRSNRLVPASRGSDPTPSWSPDGRSLALGRQSVGSRSKDLVVVRGSDVRLLAKNLDGLAFAWSRSGDRIAYTTSTPGSKGVYVVAPDSSGLRRLSERWAYDLAWSGDGKRLAIGGDGVAVLDVTSGAARPVSDDASVDLSWSPSGRTLAFTSNRGLEVVDPASGARRVLIEDRVDWTGGLRWSPDGRRLAYLLARPSGAYNAADLRTVTLNGQARAVVPAGGERGGSISSFAWTSPPAAVRYRRPSRRSVATVAQDGIVSRWPVERLVADGGRVAYVACGHVFVWTPSDARVEQAEPQTSLSPRCNSPTYYPGRGIYTLGLAGERVAFGIRGGGNTTVWWLGGTTLGRPPGPFMLGEGYRTTCAPTKGFVGDIVGSGSLLVFTSRDEARGCPPEVAEQRIVHAAQRGCPCRTLATEPGPFVPHDVDGGRIAAAGDNAVVLLDENGKRLLEVGAIARSAQLAGDDLVLAAGAELRHHDTSSGTLLHAWPVPERGSLQDAARGLAVYVLDSQVRLLRLGDGTDVGIAQGSQARFVDTGLVYADGPRLRLVTFDRLPLG